MRALPLLLLGLMGCQPEMSDMMGGDPMDGGRFDARLDLPDGAMPEEDAALDTRRINEVQMRGTVNSYHTIDHDLFPELMGYVHLPLAEQAEQQGIRVFDFDFDPDRRAGIVLEPEVTDNPLDDLTTCPTWYWCLRDFAEWMDAHPRHSLVVFLVGESWLFATTPGLHFQLDDVEWAIRQHLSPEQIFTPDDVRRDLGPVTLRDAIAREGWPTVEETRGKAMFVLNDRGLSRAEYILRGGENPERRLLFQIGDPDLADDPHMGDEVIFTFEPELVEDPWLFETDPAQLERIEALAAAGYLVHAISDDPEMIARLRAAGTHFIGTRFPDRVFGEFLPDEPVECNPVTQPVRCAAGGR